MLRRHARGSGEPELCVRCWDQSRRSGGQRGRDGATVAGKTPGDAAEPGIGEHRHFATYYVMRVRLVRKLADILDGIDVSAYKSGDIVNLSPHDAELLIAEQWAVAAEYAPDTAQPSPPASDVLLAIDQLNRQTAAPHRRRDEGMETAKGPAPRSRD
jgi:hypothetical protein